MGDKARELLPCPFCGGEAERIDFGPDNADNEGGSCIACRRCQASGPVEFGFKENFIANWNRRAALRTATEGINPVAWIRYRSDGCYEGPIMDDVIEDMRRKSGAWTPLYALAAAQEGE